MAASSIGPVSMLRTSRCWRLWTHCLSVGTRRRPARTGHEAHPSCSLKDRRSRAHLLEWHRLGEPVAVEYRDLQPENLADYLFKGASLAKLLQVSPPQDEEPLVVAGDRQR